MEEDLRVPGSLSQGVCSTLVQYGVSCMGVRAKVVCGHIGGYTNRSAIRLHSLSLRQRVRFAVPNLCLNLSSSVAQGALRENHEDSSWRAPSQVMPDLIASELGHLTQNHNVASSRSPRIYGTQFSSSVAGILSGLVNTPAQNHRLLFLRKYPRHRTDRSVTSGIILSSQPMCTLIDKVGCIRLSESGL